MNYLISSKMKPSFLPLLVFLFASCSQDTGTRRLQAQVDSLQRRLDRVYRPGLGEFMSSIQVHHTKLWFAGTNSNWKLADFEIQEIQEALDDIRAFAGDRPEVKEMGMIVPAIDSVSIAIINHNPASFKRNYIFLTNTCNGCHRATGHAFNVIIIPTSPPVSNQSFLPADSIPGH